MVLVHMFFLQMRLLPSATTPQSMACSVQSLAGGQELNILPLKAAQPLIGHAPTCPPVSPFRPLPPGATQAPPPPLAAHPPNNAPASNDDFKLTAASGDFKVSNFKVVYR